MHGGLASPLCRLLASSPLTPHTTSAAQQDEDAEEEEAVVVIDEDPETHESWASIINGLAQV